MLGENATQLSQQLNLFYCNFNTMPQNAFVFLPMLHCMYATRCMSSTIKYMLEEKLSLQFLIFESFKDVNFYI